MSEQFPVQGENLMLQEVGEVTQVAALPFGRGLVGADRHLEGQAKELFTAGLARHQHALPSGVWVPIDCMDERPIIRLADGTTDPNQLAARKAGQLAGGAVLATTKAAVAADAAYLRDAKDMQHAYEITYDLLSGFGIPDAAHEGCGASNFVEKSVGEMLETEMVLKTLGALGANATALQSPVNALAANKIKRLNDGFYGKWDSTWHADFVSQRQPENFSYLQTADDEVHGHHGSGLLLVEDGFYFAKNDFVQDTNAQSFALTLGLADKIAKLIGGSDQERNLISLAFRDDSFNVANHIVAKELEVYA